MTRTELAHLKEWRRLDSTQKTGLTPMDIIEVQQFHNKQYPQYVVWVSIGEESMNMYLFHKKIMHVKKAV